MNAIELEIQKESLVKEILGETDEVIIVKLLKLIKSHKSVFKKRNIGILKGKMTFKEEGNGKISMEEFLGL